MYLQILVQLNAMTRADVVISVGGFSNGRMLGVAILSWNGRRLFLFCVCLAFIDTWLFTPFS